MDRDSFLDTVRKNYAELIHEAYVECEHEHGEFDAAKLKASLAKLAKAAKVEGLGQKDFDDLVKSTLPSHQDQAA